MSGVALAWGVVTGADIAEAAPGAPSPVAALLAVDDPAAVAAAASPAAPISTCLRLTLMLDFPGLEWIAQHYRFARGIRTLMAD